MESMVAMPGTARLKIFLAAACLRVSHRTSGALATRPISARSSPRGGV